MQTPDELALNKQDVRVMLRAPFVIDFDKLRAALWASDHRHHGDGTITQKRLGEMLGISEPQLSRMIAKKNIPNRSTKAKFYALMMDRKIPIKAVLSDKMEDILLQRALTERGRPKLKDPKFLANLRHTPRMLRAVAANAAFIHAMLELLREYKNGMSWYEFSWQSDISWPMLQRWYGIGEVPMSLPSGPHIKTLLHLLERFAKDDPRDSRKEIVAFIKDAPRRIAALRKKLGVPSHVELAKRIGMLYHMTYWRWEQGKPISYGPRTQAAIKRILELGG